MSNMILDRRQVARVGSEPGQNQQVERDEVVRRALQDLTVAITESRPSVDVSSLWRTIPLTRVSALKQSGFNTRSTIVRGGEDAAGQISEEVYSIRIVTSSTSGEREDIAATYREYANAYVHKPIDLDKSMNAVSTIESLWIRNVLLPEV